MVISWPPSLSSALWFTFRARATCLVLSFGYICCTRAPGMAFFRLILVQISRRCHRRAYPSLSRAAHVLVLTHDVYCVVCGITLYGTGKRGPYSSFPRYIIINYSLRMEEKHGEAHRTWTIGLFIFSSLLRMLWAPLCLLLLLSPYFSLFRACREYRNFSLSDNLDFSIGVARCYRGLFKTNGPKTCWKAG